MRLLQKLYTPVLACCLNHVKLVMTVALAILVGAGFLYTQVGKTFMPTMDEGDLIVQLEKLPSINLEESLKIDMAFQRELLERVSEVTSVIARTGSDELGLDPMGLNETDSFLVLNSTLSYFRLPPEASSQGVLSSSVSFMNDAGNTIWRWLRSW